jgi:hypothetical protein
VAISHQSFGQALTELVRETEDVYVTARGLKIASFTEVLDGVAVSELRTAVHGDREPSLHLMEECARFLRVRPGYFREYRARLRDAA